MGRIIDSIRLVPDVSVITVLVPEAEFMTYQEMVQEALKRSEEEALNLEAAAKAARKEE